MQIFSIVVFPTSQKIFSASLKSLLGKTDPHEEIIKTELVDLFGFVKEYNDGIFSRMTEKESYYAYKDKEKKIIMAADFRMTKSERLNLFSKIILAQNSDALMQLLKDPETAVNSKCEDLQNLLVDAQEQTEIAMEKMIERGEDIKDTLTRTTTLKAESKQFRHVGSNLKDRMRCPSFFLGFFGLFAVIKRKIWDERVDYAFIPTQKRTPSNR